MKIGFCEETPESIWIKMVKRENGVRPPKTLDQCRKDLKFLTVVFSNHLKTICLNEALLNTDNKENLNPKYLKIEKMKVCVVVVAPRMKMQNQ